ncbi:MAG: cobalt-precorrin 5A hydrolase [Euryarchaeota archaeon]|nr:cobalt-precorrin 5A hydrolase [Euryarchaeota archaeon]
MTDTVVIALERFEEEAKKLAEMIGADYLRYSETAFNTAFESYRKIAALMSAGIAVRRIAPLIKDKWTDPCVVVISPDLRCAIPVLGGHHGGNDVARKLSEAGITPVITTATETKGLPSVEGIADSTGCTVLNRDSTRAVNSAILDGDVPVYTLQGPAIAITGPKVSVLVREGEYIVGIGCRKGTTKEEIIDAVHLCLKSASIRRDEVMVYATTTQKQGEEGLTDAVNELGGTLVFVNDSAINRHTPPSPSRAGLIGLSGVAEPAALELSKHKKIIMEKKVFGRVTIAITK